MHFLSDGQEDLTLDQWNAIEEGMVAMPASAFDDFNSEISKLCSQEPCDYETTQKLNSFFSRLNDVRRLNAK